MLTSSPVKNIFGVLMYSKEHVCPFLFSKQFVKLKLTLGIRLRRHEENFVVNPMTVPNVRFFVTVLNKLVCVCWLAGAWGGLRMLFAVMPQSPSIQCCSDSRSVVVFDGSLESVCRKCRSQAAFQRRKRVLQC